MRRLIRPAAIAVARPGCNPAYRRADSAKSLYNKGKDAEARQNYEARLRYFKQAYELKPKDLRYRAAYEHTGSWPAASHVHRGQLLREPASCDEALAEFQKAAAIDPSSFIAQQELRRTQNMINEAAQSSAADGRRTPPTGLQKRVAGSPGPVELAAISNVPITLKLTEDTKVIYETVGKLAGINVLFDPDYTSRRITHRAERSHAGRGAGNHRAGVEDFLAAGDAEHDFRRRRQSGQAQGTGTERHQDFLSVEPVAADRTAGRGERDAQMLEVPRIQPLPSQDAIIVRGTPDQIALAQKLVDDLDKAKPEVIVDVAVMQVSRDKTRNLGINPPTSATVALQNNINTTPPPAPGPTTAASSDFEDGEPDQPEPARQPERHRLHGHDSAAYGHRR